MYRPSKGRLQPSASAHLCWCLPGAATTNHAQPCGQSDITPHVNPGMTRLGLEPRSQFQLDSAPPKPFDIMVFSAQASGSCSSGFTMEMALTRGPLPVMAVLKLMRSVQAVLLIPDSGWCHPPDAGNQPVSLM